MNFCVLVGLKTSAHKVQSTATSTFTRRWQFVPTTPAYSSRSYVIMFGKVTSNIFRNCTLIWPKRTMRRCCPNKAPRNGWPETTHFLANSAFNILFCRLFFLDEKSAEPDDKRIRLDIAYDVVYDAVYVSIPNFSYKKPDFSPNPNFPKPLKKTKP